jgi:CHAD domain-containing protein
MNRHKIYIHPSIEITRGVIDVIDDLDHCLNRPEDIEANIHRIRVDIKRLRGWIRLVRDHTGEREWQEIDHCLRDMAKQLSVNRDEHVILATLGWLKDKTKNKDAQASISRINSYVQSGSCRHLFDWKTINLPDRNVLEILKRKTLLSYSDEVIRKGLQRTYKRTLKCGLQACSPGGTFAALHRLRRWVKYLYYQLEFVEVLYADDYEKIRQQLDMLGKGLGKIHDLVLVKNRLQRLPGAADCKNDINIAGMAADREINKLLKRTRRSFRKIFTMKPREIAASLQ